MTAVVLHLVAVRVLVGEEALGFLEVGDSFPCSRILAHRLRRTLQFDTCQLEELDAAVEKVVKLAEPEGKDPGK